MMLKWVLGILLAMSAGAGANAGPEPAQQTVPAAGAAGDGTIAIGQSISETLMPGGRASFTLRVPENAVVQGRFTGYGVTLDLTARDGQRLRGLATGDGAEQTFMWVASAGQQTLNVTSADSGERSYTLELTSMLPVLAESDPGPLRPAGGVALAHPPLEPALLSPKLLALQEQLARGGNTGAFWRDIDAAGTPLIEPLGRGRSLVTFLWRGARHNVKLFGAPSGDHEHLYRLGDSDAWWRSFELPDTARFSYRLAPDVPRVNGNAAVNRRLILATAQQDPRNRRTFPEAAACSLDRFQCSSVLELSQAPPQTWASPRADRTAGTLKRTRYASAILGNEREVWTYVPAAAAPQALLVLFDASAYLNRVSTPTIVDNLVADGLIPPLAVVLVENASASARGLELPPNDAFAAFLDQELMPWVVTQGLGQPAARTVIAGSSYGGLAAAYAGLVNAHWFGRVLSLSGSFWWGGPDNEPGWLARQYAQRPVQNVAFYLDSGRYELGRGKVPGIHETNGVLGEVLRKLGYPVQQVEHDTGHDYLHWQGSLGCGLISLLNPQAWDRVPQCHGRALPVEIP